MFGFFKGVKKNLESKVNTKKARDEFINLMQLEQKRIKIENELKESKSDLNTDVQKSIIENNLRTLAKVVDDFGGFNNSIQKIRDGAYFNLVGTKTSIFWGDDYDTFHNSQTLTIPGNKGNDITIETKCSRLDTGIFANITSDIIKTEKKFIEFCDSNRGKELKDSIRQRVEKIAVDKIISKTIELCNLFGEDALTMQDYIFSNLQGEIDHYHDYKSFLRRLNFAGLMYYKVYTENTNVYLKDLVHICISSVYSYNVENLIKRLKVPKQDFIITKE